MEGGGVVTRSDDRRESQPLSTPLAKRRVNCTIDDPLADPGSDCPGGPELALDADIDRLAHEIDLTRILDAPEGGHVLADVPHRKSRHAVTHGGEKAMCRGKDSTARNRR